MSWFLSDLTFSCGCGREPFLVSDQSNGLLTMGKCYIKLYIKIIYKNNEKAINGLLYILKELVPQFLSQPLLSLLLSIMVILGY